LINPFFGWIFFAPLALLGFSPKLVIASFFLNLIYQYWVHNGGIGRLGWMEKALSTPSNHRVHHARNPQYLDKNYGGILIVWDRLFGTYAPEEEAPEFGIVHPVGTRNPILINLRPITRLIAKVRLQPTLGGKLNALLGPPA
jgi:sterol desaturase/sphingolipid hydroxylase (fatty acid hydroxylase superfamily)